MIKAPFNFVPLNDKPYIAEWADLISQDIPFKDGISGTVKLRIEAKSPVFVNDKIKEDLNEVCEFCHIEQNGVKTYFIPGTSIKGMIRNVMEILSFGKMTQVQNQSFGIRELDSKKADGKFYHKKVKVDNVRCGWLRYDKGHYFLNDCGLPRRISAEELDKKFNMGLMAFIKESRNFKSDDNKTAKKKYDMFHAKHGHELLTDYFSPDNNTGITAGGRKFVRFASGGDGGTIVFTGQPGARANKGGKWSGKFFEFVFPEMIEKENVPVPENVFKAFDYIHQNSSDYKDFRKKQLRNGEEIPVFFIYDEDGNVESMGISYMYKYPAFNSVYNGIPESLLGNDGRDLCECIFGYTGKEESLKGRLQFSSAMLTSEGVFCEDTRLALAKPHPSYYPLYLGNGQTWNTERVRIAGRKRYPVRNTISSNEGTDNMNRIIRPLKQGATFEGTIRFHNLRPVELGALLSAIDFCQHEACCHSIGQGKPLGYGKVKLSVTEENMKRVVDDSPCASDQIRKAFLNEMEKNFSGWAASPQLKELFAMAEGIPTGKEAQFQYMQMSTDSDKNEFKTGLTDYSEGKQLGTFKQILDGDVPHVQQRENVSANAKREDIELKLAKEQKEREEKLANEQKKKEEMLARKAQELEQQKREAELAKQKQIVEEIANRAYEAFSNKNFEEAKKLFEEADNYNINSYKAKIDECLMKIKEEEKKTSDMPSFLAGLKLASVNAFATQMRKRHEVMPITLNDIPLIIRKIETDWDSLKPKDRKPWLDRKGWSAVEKALGADITNAIYEGIKGLPAK